MSRGEEIQAIKQAVPILDVVRLYVPNMRKEGREFVGLSPFKIEKTPSFKVDPRKNAFKCFASGHGGDVINFLMLVERCDLPTALKKLKARAGFSSNEHMACMAKRYADSLERSEREEVVKKRGKIERARRIWDATLPAGDTLVETYLASRGVDLGAIHKVYDFRIPASLRFSPRLEYWHGGNLTYEGPAMVGELVDRHGDFRGIHRTYLSDDGLAKAKLPAAKLTLGAVWGSFGQLSDLSETAVIAEGYETALSVMAALAMRGECSTFFSAIALGNMVGAARDHGTAHPTIKGRRLPGVYPDVDRPGVILPSIVKRLIICGDADGADVLANGVHLSRAVAKFKAAGIKVRVAMPQAGMDFNDMVPT